MIISPRVRVTAVSLALLVALAACAPSSVTGDGGTVRHQRIGSIQRLLTPGGYLDGVTVADGVVWAADLDGSRVVRVDARSGHQLPAVSIPDGPLAVTTAGGGVWVAGYRGDLVTRLDPGNGKVTATVETPSSAPCGLAASGGSLFIVDQSDGAGLVVDARTGAVRRTLSTSAKSGFATAVDGSVWVPDFAGTTGTVERLDGRTGARQASLRTGQAPVSVSGGASSVWVVDSKAQTVVRLNPANGAIQARIPMPGAGPVAVLVSDGAAWVTGYASHKLYRIDLSTNAVTGTLGLPGPAQNMAMAGGLLWVTMSNGRIAGVALS